MRLQTLLRTIWLASRLCASTAWAYLVKWLTIRRLPSPSRLAGTDMPSFLARHLRDHSASERKKVGRRSVYESMRLRFGQSFRWKHPPTWVLKNLPQPNAVWILDTDLEYVIR